VDPQINMQLAIFRVSVFFLTACRVETERSYASGGLAIQATVHHQPQLNLRQAWCCRSALEAAKGPEKGQKDVKQQKGLMS